MQQFLVRMQSLEMNNIILHKKKMKEPKNSFTKNFFYKKHVMNMHQTKIGSNTKSCIGFSFFRSLSQFMRRVNNREL